MRSPAGVLQNEKTGRFHAIFFRLSPRPSSEPTDNGQRYKSAAHHTDGSATLDEARAFIGNYPDYKDVGAVWKWDGDGVPAIVQDFASADLR